MESEKGVIIGDGNRSGMQIGATTLVLLKLKKNSIVVTLYITLLKGRRSSF
jgi:hypothetical protein